MNGYVDLSEKVTTTFYDQEYEEWTQQTVTVADVLNSVCDDYMVLQSAQPEIIYCKDCKYLDVQGTYGECGKGLLGIVNRDDFCSRAERRTK